MAGQRHENEYRRERQRPKPAGRRPAATQNIVSRSSPPPKPTGPTRASRRAASYGPPTRPVRRRGAARRPPCRHGAENAYRSSSAGAGAFAVDGYARARQLRGRRTGRLVARRLRCPRRIPKWPLAGDFSQREEPPGRRGILLPTIRVSGLPAVIAGKTTRLAARADSSAHAADSRGEEAGAPAIRCRSCQSAVPARSTRNFSRPWGLRWCCFSALTLASPSATRGVRQQLPELCHAVRWVPTPTHAQAKATPVPWCMRRRLRDPGQQAVIKRNVAGVRLLCPGRAQCCPLRVCYDPNAYNGYAIGGSHAEESSRSSIQVRGAAQPTRAQSPTITLPTSSGTPDFSRDGYSWREWRAAVAAGAA